MVTQIDMTPDGHFVSPPGGSASPLVNRILCGAIIVAVLAAAGALAALTFWVALALIPIAIGAALVAYLVLRYRLWRAGYSVRGQRPSFRPPFRRY